jgi:SAM-dependent methyltransferase
MKETSKSYNLRLARGDFQKYLYGKGLDIGAGDDPLKIQDGEVIVWDKTQGDAQDLKEIADSSFDFVYSSHCLEHLIDIETALCNWCRIIKNNGYLYLTLPDYLLYEKLSWPSWNGDHRHSFSIDIPRSKTKRDNHFQIEVDLVLILKKNGMELVFCLLEDENFNYNTAPAIDQTLKGALAQICIIAVKKV